MTPFLATSFGGDMASSPATIGGAIGYAANERITLEGEIGVTPSGKQGDLIEVDTSLWTLSGNVLYHFLRPSFTPYAVAGLGLVSSDPDFEEIGLPDVGNDTSFAWNLGGGIKSALNDRFGIRADLRYINANDEAPDHWRLYGGLVIRRLGQ